MKNYKAKNVSAYIAVADSAARPLLAELRKIVKLTVPKAEESISWGVPFYKYQGVLAGFAALKNHIDFGLVTALSPVEREMFEKNGYKTGKKTLKIGFGQKIPVRMIRQILKEKAKMNELKKTKK